MLSKNELKILETLIGNLNSEFTLFDMSRTLKQRYSQTYKSIKSLMKKDLVKTKKIGKSKVVGLNLLAYHPEYSITEIERLSKAIENKRIKMVLDKILNIDGQFICALFGSYAAGKMKEDSDIDLLFILPQECSISRFEKVCKSQLSIYNADINIIAEKSLFEMWASPQELNVGNELFKSHIILLGAESFINLVRKRYVGR